MAHVTLHHRVQILNIQWDSKRACVDTQLTGRTEFAIDAEHGSIGCDTNRFGDTDPHADWILAVHTDLRETTGRSARIGGRKMNHANPQMVFAGGARSFTGSAIDASCRIDEERQVTHRTPPA